MDGGKHLTSRLLKVRKLISKIGVFSPSFIDLVDMSTIKVEFGVLLTHLVVRPYGRVWIAMVPMLVPERRRNTGCTQKGY